MGIYDRLETAGYEGIVQTDTLVSWELALKATPHKKPIVTKAFMYAKRDGKFFKIVLARHYPNRSSEPTHSSVDSVVEVAPSEHIAVTAKIGPNHVHNRW